MAVNISIYSNANTATRSIAVDFVGDVLAANQPSNVASYSIEYYFKFTTGAKQTDNVAFAPKIARSLDELALGGNAVSRKQAATNTNNTYSDIRSMIVDYTYDYIYGHAANKFSSGVTLQQPMKFT